MICQGILVSILVLLDFVLKAFSNPLENPPKLHVSILVLLDFVLKVKAWI